MRKEEKAKQMEAALQLRNLHNCKVQVTFSNQEDLSINDDLEESGPVLEMSQEARRNLDINNLKKAHGDGVSACVTCGTQLGVGSSLRLGCKCRICDNCWFDKDEGVSTDYCGKGRCVDYTEESLHCSVSFTVCTCNTYRPADFSSSSCILLLHYHFKL
jgi:hypothetical protein